MTDIGKTIRHIREEKKMTQDELAEKLFVTRQTISSYETGRTKPDIEMLVKLASVFNMDIHDLIYGPPDLQIHMKMKYRFCFAAILSVVMLLCNHHLTNWAALEKTFQYNVLPTMLVYVLFKPVMYGLLGWTAAQGIGTFCKLRPFHSGTAKKVKLCILILTITYCAIQLPLIASAAMGFSLPRQWTSLAFFILGAHPGWPHSDFYLFASFLIGASLWLCGIFHISQNEITQ